MKGCQCSEIKSILTLSREIYIDFVEDAVSKVGLLVQRPLDRVALALGEERKQGVWPVSMFPHRGGGWLTGVNDPEPHLVHHQHVAVSEAIIIIWLFSVIHIL